MHPIIENNRTKIIELCKQHHVKELYAFGSVVRDDFNAESDVDFLASFAVPAHAEKDHSHTVFNDIQDYLRTQLALLLSRQVDLITESNIRNKYLRYFINQEKMLLHAEA